MLQIFRPSLNWLLILVPVCVYVEHTSPDSHTLIFALSCGAIVPLAGLLGKATEHVADRAGENIGGFLNATLGNAAELIIAVVALKQGLIDVVKASLTGSIIGNVSARRGTGLCDGWNPVQKPEVQRGCSAVAGCSSRPCFYRAHCTWNVPLSEPGNLGGNHTQAQRCHLCRSAPYLSAQPSILDAHSQGIVRWNLRPSSRCERASGTTPGDSGRP